MKNLVVIFSLLAVLVSIQASAKSIFGPESVIEIEAGRNVFYQYAPGDTDKPTLVFLPGVNRALPEEYPAFKLLAAQGYGLLITATSSHWQSLVTLEKQTPYFEKNSELTVSDFNEETEIVIKTLKIKKPVMVALSYSSAMAAFTKLNKIYVAPMVKASDSNPQGAKAAAQWEATLALNPFFGAIWIRQFRDSNYRKHWSPMVEDNQAAYGEGADLDQILNGYVSISRAAEDFDLTEASFAGTGEKLFILGEYESQIRLRGQFETINKAVKSGPTRVLIVRRAEHNVPQSQPKAFETAMLELLTTKSAAKLKVGVIDSKKSKEIRWLAVSEVKALFAEVLSLSDSTDSADLSSVLGK